MNLTDLYQDLSNQYGGEFDNSPLPVDKWQPQNCGDIGLEIRKDGTWWQNGQKFQREKLIRLFCRILRKDDDGNTYLITPYEKIIIKVEDAHFQIVRADLIDSGAKQKIILTPNYGNSFELNENHNLWVIEAQNGPRPYVMVRNGLIGLIGRAVYYDLVAWGIAQNNDFGIYSNGGFFKLGELSAG